MSTNLTDYQKGFILGLLIGEGHFGGDGKQPQIALLMRVRHLPVLQWVHRMLPGGQLYGPYYYSGRRSYQLVFRHSYLRQVVVPMLQRLPWCQVDPHSYGRFLAMVERYGMRDMLPCENPDWDERLMGPQAPRSWAAFMKSLKQKVPRGTSPLILPQRAKSLRKPSRLGEALASSVRDAIAQPV